MNNYDNARAFEYVYTQRNNKNVTFLHFPGREHIACNEKYFMILNLVAWRKNAIGDTKYALEYVHDKLDGSNAQSKTMPMYIDSLR